MMKSAVLVFLISYAVCEEQGSRDQNCYVSLATTVGALTEKVANLVDKVTQLETKLQTTEGDLTELKSITQGTPKVAFSASLYGTGTNGNTGPFNTNTPLKYQKVFYNLGSNYSPSTGIFTASVKGIYFFHFTIFINQDSPNSFVSLMKNSDRVVSVWDISKSDNNDMGSNAAVLPLEVGDTAYVQLHANRAVYDDSGLNLHSFTGFLLFTE